LPKLPPLAIRQHRRDETQPRERSLSLGGLVEIEFKVTNCWQPRFTHDPSRIAVDMPQLEWTVQIVKSASMEILSGLFRGANQAG